MRSSIVSTKRYQNFCLAVFVALFLITQSLLACTSFRLQDGDNLVFTKNYDWFLEHGLLIVNKRNVAKTAALLDRSAQPAQWVSKYGSVTFNQYGREFPIGGMNEAGLAMETLILAETQYPAPDDRPAVMAWMQYQLDNHGTVEQVIASDSKIRVARDTPIPIHFTLCDRGGNMATVEFVGGKMVYHEGNTLPVKVLTNDTYDNSLAYLNRHAGFGGTKEIAHGSRASLDRFVCAADKVRKYKPDTGTSIMDYAFDTLASVSQGDATKWVIVYDLKKLQIHYKTLHNPKLKTIRLGDLDFDCHTPVRIMSINTARSGLLNPYFHEYEVDLNRWLVFYSFKQTGQLAEIPNEVLELFAQYPETTVCK
jgi:choloylglycine hydrolase